MLTKGAHSGILCLTILALFAGILSGADALAPPGTLVNAGGYRVHLYCTGAGSPAVIVAGAGFSFDWGLVQPNVAAITRICTYDPSGTAWSDPFPSHRTPACSDRVTELHAVLQHASVDGPVVLVGFSIGALYARLYASRYPEDVAGMVIVDHAFIDLDHAPPPLPEKRTDSRVPPADGVFSVQDVDTPPAVIFQAPVAVGMEDDPNFQRLPKLNRDLHAWAMAENPLRPTVEAAAECVAELAGRPHLPDTKPLVVIGTNNDSPGYRQLQAQLLGLSRNAKQVIAGHSTHMVIVDEPETVVKAIVDVVISLRSPNGRPSPAR